MAGGKENEEFKDMVVVTHPLDEAVDYINGTLDPGDVFDTKYLDDWALDNGYIKKEEK